LGFEFTDIPVAQIFKTIEQAYLVNIDFPQAKLKDCYLTTSLNDQPLPEKLKIICRALVITLAMKWKPNYNPIKWMQLKNTAYELGSKAPKML
jgi:hypothetical protein